MHRTRLFHVAPLMVLGFVMVSAAQAGDGFIGVYVDSAGTVPCATISQMTGATLYVIASLDGASTAGISGAEFRIEVENPTGWAFLGYSPPPANIVIGNVLDLNPQEPNDGSGVNIVFGDCREPVGAKIPMGTISVFNYGGGATRLFVKRHSAPLNAGYQCPLFTICNEPIFTKFCMTPSTEPACSLSTSKILSTTTTADPIFFAATLNGDSPRTGLGPSLPTMEIIARFKRGVIQFPLNTIGAVLRDTPIGGAPRILDMSDVRFL